MPLTRRMPITSANGHMMNEESKEEAFQLVCNDVVLLIYFSSFLSLSRMTFAESALPTLTTPAFQSTTIGHLMELACLSIISSGFSTCSLEERNMEEAVREPLE